jgi:hypothetical protein
MLALLCLVCVWFWGPLVLPKSESTKPAKAATASPTAAPASAASTVAAAPAEPKLDWKVLAERIAGDVRMTGLPPEPAVEGRRLRSPFAAVKPQQAATDEIDELAAQLDALGLLNDTAGTPPQPELSDEDAWRLMPLKLSSTLVGARARKAVINDRAFSEGTAIGTLGELEIRLQRVTPRSAIVVWNGTPRELRIPKPGETIEEPQAAAGDQNELEVGEPSTLEQEAL